MLRHAIVALLACLPLAAHARDYQFDGQISRPVLENYLSRSITMLDLLTGHGNVDDNIRMLRNTGAKFAGRSIYLWGQEGQLRDRLAAARQIAPKIHAADPEMILQACVFEIVSKEVDRISVPAWAFEAFGQSPEQRNFRYEAMIYPNGRGRDHWGPGLRSRTSARRKPSSGFTSWPRRTSMWAVRRSISDRPRSWTATILIMGTGGTCSSGSGLTPKAMPGVTGCCATLTSRAAECCTATGCSSTSTHSRCESSKSWTGLKRAFCRWEPSTASTDEAWAGSLRAAGDASTCRIWWNWTIGASATGRQTWSGRMLGLGLRRDLLVRTPRRTLPKRVAPLCPGLGARA